MSKILSNMEKHKEVFFVIRLLDAKQVANMGPIIDQDPTISCELMNGRDEFLNFARERHHEFSSLRRAKYSSMALLYELHNQNNEKFIFKCNKCSSPIETTRYHCTVCDDFDLCVPCYEQRGGHEHKMDKLACVSSDKKENGGDNKPLNPAKPPKHSIETYLKAFMHAVYCRNANCTFLKCMQFKRVVQHSKNCQKFKNSQCEFCKQMIALCIYHAKNCKENMCQVPFCSTIKIKLKQQKAYNTTLERRRMQIMTRTFKINAQQNNNTSGSNNSNNNNNNNTDDTDNNETTTSTITNQQQQQQQQMNQQQPQQHNQQNMYNSIQYVNSTNNIPQQNTAYNIMNNQNSQNQYNTGNNSNNVNMLPQPHYLNQQQQDPHLIKQQNFTNINSPGKIINNQTIPQQQQSYSLPQPTRPSSTTTNQNINIQTQQVVGYNQQMNDNNNPWSQQQQQQRMVTNQMPQQPGQPVQPQQQLMHSQSQIQQYIQKLRLSSQEEQKKILIGLQTSNPELFRSVIHVYKQQQMQQQQLHQQQQSQQVINDPQKQNIILINNTSNNNPQQTQSTHPQQQQWSTHNQQYTQNPQYNVNTQQQLINTNTTNTIRYHPPLPTPPPQSQQQQPRQQLIINNSQQQQQQQILMQQQQQQQQQRLSSIPQMTQLRHQNSTNFQNLRPQVPPNYPIQQQQLQNGYVNNMDSKDQMLPGPTNLLHQHQQGGLQQHQGSQQQLNATDKLSQVVETL
jgi:E1A/CREB-binding protein